MNILYYTWNEITRDDMTDTLRALGHTVKTVCYALSSYTQDAGFVAFIEKELSLERYDCMITANYLPVLSKISFRNQMIYIAWVYDCPCLTLYSEMVYNPYNFIFHFDRTAAAGLRKRGVRNVWHQPMAVHTARLEALTAKPCTNGKLVNQEISFLGNLYTDAYNSIDRIQGLSDYQKGFIQAVIASQLTMWGADLIGEAFPEEFLSGVLKRIAIDMEEEVRLDSRELLLDMVRKKASVMERQELLALLSTQFKTTLYSQSDSSMLPGVQNRGYLNYSLEMPVMFYHTKINLNITLRSIFSGISLRALDIMGAGGFLLSNYQPELAAYFEDGKEVVLYYDRQDLMDKARYYLAHDAERAEIAANGHQKVKEQFDYAHAWKNIFSTVFGQK